jgi:hypothetical protein
MMEAASTSETSVNIYQIARRNIPEDCHIQIFSFHGLRNDCIDLDCLLRTECSKLNPSKYTNFLQYILVHGENTLYLCKYILLILPVSFCLNCALITILSSQLQVSWSEFRVRTLTTTAATETNKVSTLSGLKQMVVEWFSECKLGRYKVVDIQFGCSVLLVRGYLDTDVVWKRNSFLPPIPRYAIVNCDKLFPTFA